MAPHSESSFRLAPDTDPGSPDGPDRSTSLWHDTGRARSFDQAADEYDTARPGYPPVLFDTIETLIGRPLHGADAVDVGAGTGIATRLLTDRGARVLAVEPGDGMAARFRRSAPHTPLVRATGDFLPLADNSADLITYAQSWHWTNPLHSLPEALRVLRPDGLLALWWNIADRTVPWVAAQAERLHNTFGDSAHGAPGTTRRLPAGTPGATEHRLHWTRRVPLDTHLANLSTHSVFLTAAPDTAAAVLRRERAALTEVFPDGHVTEEYVVELISLRPRPTS
ncbi:class I SAM-dependent methyltransferase [Streptomyces yaizuensis]|uniref:Class I SAM-dependent methyltransferase n=1 Tax=Streptomyces yaizuensis TaxID=2989713 RepID=A0ABQ5P0H9_9ACTN|nr:class I SAM-dependent methyltransferase [Streptomyces sp. YSPA8]GLF96117.1 class I SAM-dependent methyltransferase [Streptomyces sp. YSPA8]